MSPTPGRGAATADTLHDRMLQSEFGVLIPAGQAAQRLRLKDEALRRYGAQVETLLDCALPKGEAGARMYPEQLIVLMERAQTMHATGRARKRQDALATLLASEGWIAARDDGIDPTPADSLDAAAQRAILEDLRALVWRMADLGPRLGGVLASTLAESDELKTVMNRVTLELPQLLPHLARIHAAHHAVQHSAAALSRQTIELARTADNLAEHTAALHRERGAMRRWLKGAPWVVGLSAGLGGLLGGLVSALFHS